MAVMSTSDSGGDWSEYHEGPSGTNDWCHTFLANTSAGFVLTYLPPPTHTTCLPLIDPKLMSVQREEIKLLLKCTFFKEAFLSNPLTKYGSLIAQG